MSSNSFYGLDFGTSNTAISMIKPSDSECHMIPLEGKNPVLPSAIFYSFEYTGAAPVEYGRAATARYVEHERGRYFRSLKSVLGSKIATDRFMIKDDVETFSSIMIRFITHVKSTAEKSSGNSIDNLVIGRPVFFVDNDTVRDNLAQSQLKEIVSDLGVKNIEFQYEPVAAAMDFEQSLTQEELALIVDMGGGTSDFTVIKIGGTNALKIDRSSDILSNNGIHIGGTDLDTLMSLAYVMPEFGYGSLTLNGVETMSTPFKDMATWHRIHMLYHKKEQKFLRDMRLELRDKTKFDRFLNVINNRLGYAIAYEVETAKIELSSSIDALIDLDEVERDLDVIVTRDQFVSSISQEITDLRRTMQKTIDIAGVKNSDITQIFFTGGTTGIPIIQATVKDLFPGASIVRGNSFCSVAQGLALDAKRRFG